MDLAQIKKLADLARIDMSEEEMISIAKDFDPILAYVGQVQEALETIENIPKVEKAENHFLHNIVREDVTINKPGEYTEKILKEMPDTQDGYLKVKQIL